MKYLYHFILFAGIALFFPCCRPLPLVSSIRPTEVKDVQKFEPFSYISLVKTENQGHYNDSLSQISKTLLSRALDRFKPRLPLSGKIAVTDSLALLQLKRELNFICINAERYKDVSHLKISPFLDSLVEKTGKRFALLTFSTGFTRAKGNYAGEIAKGIGIGILTLGMYVQTPIKARSVVYAVIVDSKENNVAFYQRSLLDDEEPLSEDNLGRQVQQLFENYFWLSPQ